MRDCEIARLESEIRHVLDLLAGHKELDELRHTSEQEARTLASQDIDRRLEGMNKFREQLMQERGSYVSRDLHDKLEQGMDVRIKALENIRSNFEGRLLAVGGAVALILWLVGHFLK